MERQLEVSARPLIRQLRCHLLPQGEKEMASPMPAPRRLTCDSPGRGEDAVFANPSVLPCEAGSCHEVTEGRAPRPSGRDFARRSPKLTAGICRDEPQWPRVELQGGAVSRPIRRGDARPWYRGAQGPVDPQPGQQLFLHASRPKPSWCVQIGEVDEVEALILVEAGEHHGLDPPVSIAVRLAGTGRRISFIMHCIGELIEPIALCPAFRCWASARRGVPGPPPSSSRPSRWR